MVLAGTLAEFVGRGLCMMINMSGRGQDGKVMDNLSVGVRTNKNNLRQCSDFNKQRRMLIKGKEKNAKKKKRPWQPCFIRNMFMHH